MIPSLWITLRYTSCFVKMQRSNLGSDANAKPLWVVFTFLIGVWLQLRPFSLGKSQQAFNIIGSSIIESPFIGGLSFHVRLQTVPDDQTPISWSLTMKNGLRSQLPSHHSYKLQTSFWAAFESCSKASARRRWFWYKQNTDSNNDPILREHDWKCPKTKNCSIITKNKL